MYNSNYTAAVKMYKITDSIRSKNEEPVIKNFLFFKPIT